MSALQTGKIMKKVMSSSTTSQDVAADNQNKAGLLNPNWPNQSRNTSSEGIHPDPSMKNSALRFSCLSRKVLNGKEVQYSTQNLSPNIGQIVGDDISTIFSR